MKKLKIFISIIIVISCMFVLSSCKYIFNNYNEINEELPDNINSAKSMTEYALDVVEKDSGKEFLVGFIGMTLDSELKGEVEVILVEKKQKKPLLVYVDFDTKNNKFLSFRYVTWNSKAHPGVINMHKWKIDCEEAIKISEEVFSETDGFRYDRVSIHTSNPYPYEDEDWEDLLVSFFDDQNKMYYYTRIDLYTGEISAHGSHEYIKFY